LVPQRGFVDVGSAFVADAESAVLVEPADGSFDDPAFLAQAGAARAPLPGDLALDAAGSGARGGAAWTGRRGRRSASSEVEDADGSVNVYETEVVMLRKNL
jgi:hypothetical protein